MGFLTVGRIRLHFDPPGYRYPVKPPFDFELRGDQVTSGRGDVEIDGESPPPLLKPTDNFFNPPDSEFMMCRPRQFDPAWYRDTVSFPNAIARKSRWAFHPGINLAHVQEFEPTNVAGGTSYPNNQWMTFTVPSPLTGTAPMAVNLTNLQAAAGVTLETGTAVVARTSNVQYASKMPFLQTWMPPSGQDQFLFGFANLALLLHRGNAILLRATDPGYQTWQKLAQWGPNSPVGGRASGILGPSQVINTASPGPATGAFEGIVRSFMFLELPPDYILIGGEAHHRYVRLRKTRGQQSVPTMLPHGRWWIAAAPQQKLMFQFQAVAFHEAEHARLTDPTDVSETYWDMLPEHAPSSALIGPEVRGHLHSDGDATNTGVVGGQISASAATGESVEVRVVSVGATNEAWVSDGVKHKGALRFHFVPGNDLLGNTDFGATDCTSPVLYYVGFRFPEVLADRYRVAGAILTDEQFRVSLESSLRVRDGGRMEVLLNNRGAAAFEAFGMNRRHDFPVHLEHDVAGNGTYSETVGRYWVRKPETKIAAWKDGDSNQPIRGVVLACESLMARLEDSPWTYQSTIVDPVNGGRIEHTTVAARVLGGAGINTADPALVYIETDLGPLDARMLPGGSRDDAGGVGAKRTSPYAASANEGRGSYLGRLGKVWRGWLFWVRMDGQYRYERDRQDDVRAGLSLAPVAVFYKSRESAIAHGVHPQQKFGALSDEIIHPAITNTVKVLGTDREGKRLPAVVDYWGPSLTDLTAPNFMGEPLRAVVLRPKIAVTLKAMMQIAWYAIRRLSRTTVERNVMTFLPPWGVEPAAVDGNDVIELEDVGKFIIAHLKTSQVGGYASRRGQPADYLWETPMKLEFIPPAAP